METNDFEWNEKKSEKNLAERGFSFAYATRVFLDSHHIIIDTSREEDNEKRYKAIGMIEGKRFIVVFTWRNNHCRIISARRTNKSEDRCYDKTL